MAEKRKVCPPKDGPTNVAEKKRHSQKKYRRQANYLVKKGISPARVLGR